MEKKRERVKRIMYYSSKAPEPTVLRPDPFEWNGKLIEPPRGAYYGFRLSINFESFRPIALTCCF